MKIFYRLPVPLLRRTQVYSSASVDPFSGLDVRRRDFLALIGTTAALRPLAGTAQPKMPVIGFLSVGAPMPSAASVAAFRQGLADSGYVEGENVAIEYRGSGGHLHQLPRLAAELVERKVDAIVATGGPEAAFAAKKATATTPIVFSVALDPAEVGLLDNPARPEGNVTGIVVLDEELFPKQIELLSELIPQLRIIALLASAQNPVLRKPVTSAMQEATSARGIELQRLATSTEAEIGAAFAALSQKEGRALLVAGDRFFDHQRDQLIAVTIRHKIPAIFYNRLYAEAGGLITYGLTIGAAPRQVGVYVGRLLAGAKPADLPVQRPTDFELVINLRTAKLLDLTVPEKLLSRADKVIE
jgi:putative tryptophan/tyrosine transport system substrate-binding protein